VRYDIWFKWQQAIEEFSMFDDIFNTGVWKWLLFELLINNISPYRFLDGYKYVEYNDAYNYEIEYDVNDILLFFMFIRLYNLGKAILIQTYYLSPRA
jgi:hypothetical protein